MLAIPTANENGKNAEREIERARREMEKGTQAKRKALWFYAFHRRYHIHSYCLFAICKWKNEVLDILFIRVWNASIETASAGIKKRENYTQTNSGSGWEFMASKNEYINRSFISLFVFSALFLTPFQSLSYYLSSSFAHSYRILLDFDAVFCRCVCFFFVNVCINDVVHGKGS